jgi:hypothetical protein
MDEIRIVMNPFYKGRKAKGVKVYDGKRRKVVRNEHQGQQERECNCSLCRMSKGITREVRGQFNRYGKI